MSMQPVYYVPVPTVLVQQQQQHMHGFGAHTTSGRPCLCFPDAATMYTLPEASSVAMGTLAHTLGSLAGSGLNNGLGTCMQFPQLGSCWKPGTVQKSNWLQQHRQLLDLLNAPAGPAGTPVSAADLGLLAKDGALDGFLATWFPMEPIPRGDLERLPATPVGAEADDPIAAALHAPYHAVEVPATAVATSHVAPAGTGHDCVVSGGRCSALSMLDTAEAEEPPTPTAAAGEDMLFINQSNSSLQGGSPVGGICGCAAQTADW